MFLNFIGLILLSGLIIWYIKHRNKLSDLKKIPGPPHLPIVGVLFDILFATPEQIFKSDREKARKYYPILREEVFNIAAVSVFIPEDIELALTITRQKSIIYEMLHSWLGTGLLTSYGKKWQIRRKILTPAFHFSILQDFVKIFNAEAVKLVENLEKSNEDSINIIPPISQFTLHSVIGNEEVKSSFLISTITRILETSMGIKLNSTSSSSRKYKDAVHEVGKIITQRINKPWLLNENLFQLTLTARKYQKTIKTLHDFSKNVINTRKNSLSVKIKKRPAMLDILLAASIEDEGIREEVDTFIFEGHDTTSVAISFILLVLANHKDVQTGIREEIIDTIGDSGALPTYQDLQNLEYTDRCIKECLRLFPSVPFIGRLAEEDIHTTTGHKIPKGTMIHIHIYDIHRDPRIYPDPEKFDPDRFLPENIQKRHPFAFIPFSAGQRNCIGQKFAMLELKSALCGILRKFILEPVDTIEDLIFVTDLVLRTKNPIRIKFQTRKVPNQYCSPTIA